MSTVHKNTKCLIIGVLGRIGAGKSTFCRIAQNQFSADYFSVVAPLKAMSRSLFDLTDEQVNGTTVQKEAVDERYDASPRDLMRRVGKAAREQFGNNVWMGPTVNEMSHHYLDQHYITRSKCLMVVDSLRFPEEIEALKEIDVSYCGSVNGDWGWLNAEVRVVKLASDNPAASDDQTEACVDLVPDRDIDYKLANLYSSGLKAFEDLCSDTLRHMTAGWL